MQCQTSESLVRGGSYAYLKEVAPLKDLSIKLSDKGRTIK